MSNIFVVMTKRISQKF